MIIDTIELWQKKFSNVQNSNHISLGINHANDPVFCEISKLRHIAVIDHTATYWDNMADIFITSFISSTTNTNLILCEKRSKFTKYEKLPHLIAPIVTNDSHMGATLEWIVRKIQSRYDILRQTFTSSSTEFEGSLAKKIKSRIIIMIKDSDMFMRSDSKRRNEYIQEILRTGADVNVHLIIFTNQFHGSKYGRENFSLMPTKIDIKPKPNSGELEIKVDCIDGAKFQLMPIFLNPEVNDLIIKSRVKADTSAMTEDFFNDSILTDDDEIDPLYEEALAVVSYMQSANTSVMQRMLRIGYARASRIIEQLTSRNIIGSLGDKKPKKKHIKT